MDKISVNVSKKYDILVGRGVIDNAHAIISNYCPKGKIAIVTDDIVDGLYGNKLLNSLIEAGYVACKFVFENGEKAKCFKTLSEILEFLAIHSFKRDDCLIALGGGVVGDITGLSAALYMRGIKFIQIPTTLLAMVDASIGGKTAVDLKAGKNLAGAFWQPSLVVCDIDIIEKLPKDIFTEGMGEVIKYDVIGNYGIMNDILQNKLMDNLSKTILNCIEFKKKVVEEDEFETKGIRKILNVGHTIAHGIEKISNYEISHGYAVGTGLVWEAAIAYKLNLCPLNLFELIKKVVIMSGLLVNLDCDKRDLIDAMKNDKKNSDDLISFILPIELGNCVEKKLSTDELEYLLGGIDSLL